VPKEGDKTREKIIEQIGKSVAECATVEITLVSRSGWKNMDRVLPIYLLLNKY